MKTILVIFLFITNFLFANELTTKESSAFGTPLNNEITSKHNEYVAAKNLYLSYLSNPKHIYKNQRFEIEVKALITRTNYDYIKTDFINGKNMIPLNPNQSWKKSKSSSNIYTNKYYFKAYEKKFTMPSIKVSLYKNKKLVEVRVLSSLKMTFSGIA